MSTGSEVVAKSDFPSGYAGYVPNVRHDVIFLNTGVARLHEERRTDPARKKFPQFNEQIAGNPIVTLSPRGPREAPPVPTPRGAATTSTTAGTAVQPPWGVTAKGLALDSSSVPSMMRGATKT